MKFCTKCGRQLDDNAMYCDKCGSTVVGGSSDSFAADPFNENNGMYNDSINSTSAPQPTQSKRNDNATMKLVAKIFMILSCVAAGFALIPLAWMIPMTVSYCNKIKNHEEVSLGFKICTLIFVNMVSGILMLCDEEL